MFYRLRESSLFNQSSITDLSNSWQKSRISPDNWIWLQFLSDSCNHRCFWMQILMVFFQIVLHSMYIFILSGYYCWGQFISLTCECRMAVSNVLVCSAVTTKTVCILITLNWDVLSLDVIPLSSHKLHDFFITFTFQATFWPSCPVQ